MASATDGDIPILGSSAVARLADDGAVEVRCDDPTCGRLLYKLDRMAGVGISVSRLCPGLHGNVNCALINTGLVTDQPGVPAEGGLPSDWRCTQCDRHLAHVHAVKGRITVRCRCRAKVGVTAANAINVTQGLARAS